MKRGIALFYIPLVMVASAAQSQSPATPNPETPDASSAASAEHIYGPKEGVKPPKLTHDRSPEYPKKARNSGKEGTVVLGVVVGPDGLTRDITVARPLGTDFDQAAIDAVKKWKFSPATKDGKPVAVKINVEVAFRDPR